jgi:hypothetical protein
MGPFGRGRLNRSYIDIHVAVLIDRLTSNEAAGQLVGSLYHVSVIIQLLFTDP